MCRPSGSGSRRAGRPTTNPPRSRRGNAGHSTRRQSRLLPSPHPVPSSPPAHSTPALSVRVGRCRYGSPSVGADQRPGKALASLPPSVGGIPPSVARCRPLSLPLNRTSGGRAAQGGRGRSSAGFGWPGRPGRRRSKASCALPMSGHTTPMVPAAHPRHAKRVTAAEGGRSRSKATPPFGNPRQAQAPVTGRTGSPACGSGWR